ncbi:MAG TPA: dTDP-glucose 4,6-dehydratase [Bacteroidota bacterium]|nr:dTDP-glucose 4,6-dehydratase [Bacteroidota bacterium]
MRNVLVTGGAGFIGSNFVHFFLAAHPDVHLVNFDSLTYAGNLGNLVGVASGPNYTFVRGDICDRAAVEKAFEEHAIDTVVHFAAESHVDRSIMGAAIFVNTNVVGTQVLLDVARERKIERFLHVSTDEVYGSLGPSGKFTEQTPVHPNSPYAASKASSDLLALASQHTFGLPVIVTRCSNNYGPYQFPEKLIPLMIVNALNNKELPVYGQGLNVRDWLYVGDHCSAIDVVLRKGSVGEVYNIGGENEWKNIDIVRLLLKHLGKPESLIRFVKDRPGHDLRYAIDASKIRLELGWSPSVTFDQGIAKTIDWYLANEAWWRKIIDGSYRDYYQEMYHGR